MAGYFTSNRKVLEHRKLARMERRSRMERERHKRALHIRKTTSCSRRTASSAVRRKTSSCSTVPVHRMLAHMELRNRKSEQELRRLARKEPVRRKLARKERRNRTVRVRRTQAQHHIRKTTSCSRQTAWQASRLCDIHRNPYCIRKGHSYLGHMRPTLR